MERWEFWNNALSRHNINIQELAEQTPDYPEAATQVWKQYAGHALYGDKSPNYFDCMQALAREFPNARFIVIWRDLADTCRSIVQASEGSAFFAKRGMIHRALTGYRKMKRECDALELKGVPLHQIHYEELVQSPETVMRGICCFLQIPFDARMASLQGADRSAIYEAPQHAGVKSETIGLNGKTRTALPAGVGEKIARYVAYWKRKSGGSWPMYPAVAAAKPAGVLERAADELYFRALRTFDRFTAFVYCHAPLSVLRKYRVAKGQKPMSPAAQSPALSQASNQN